MSLYTARLALKTQASGLTSGALTLIADRIILGYYKLEEDNAFFDTLDDDGPLLLIRAGALDGQDKQSGVSRIKIPCDFWVGIPRNENETFQDIEGLLDEIVEAWDTETSFDAPEIDSKKTIMTVHYSLIVQKDFC